MLCAVEHVAQWCNCHMLAWYEQGHVVAATLFSLPTQARYGRLVTTIIHPKRCRACACGQPGAYIGCRLIPDIIHHPRRKHHQLCGAGFHSTVPVGVPVVGAVSDKCPSCMVDARRGSGVDNVLGDVPHHRWCVCASSLPPVGVGWSSIVHLMMPLLR